MFAVMVADLVPNVTVLALVRLVPVPVTVVPSPGDGARSYGRYRVVAVFHCVARVCQVARYGPVERSNGSRPPAQKGFRAGGPWRSEGGILRSYLARSR